VCSSRGDDCRESSHSGLLRGYQNRFAFTENCGWITGNPELISLLAWHEARLKSFLCCRRSQTIQVGSKWGPKLGHFSLISRVSLLKGQPNHWDLECDLQLITRRSSVQICPPQPIEEVLGRNPGFRPFLFLGRKQESDQSTPRPTYQKAERGAPGYFSDLANDAEWAGNEDLRLEADS
jgi:hypothetical protein